MTELKQLLLDAIHEIHSLRHANQILSAKVEMIELFECVLHTQPVRRGHLIGRRPGQTEGLSNDVAHLLALHCQGPMP
jgi:hypothetical protein